MTEEQIRQIVRDEIERAGAKAKPEREANIRLVIDGKCIGHVVYDAVHRAMAMSRTE